MQYAIICFIGARYLAGKQATRRKWFVIVTSEL